MTTKYLRKYTVSFSDMDINYRLTKIAAVKFFQETFARNCAKHQLAAFDIISKNLVWVISDLHIEFLSTLPCWSEDFEVETWISEKTQLKTFIDFKIYYKSHVVAQGDSCFYLLNTKNRHPVKSIDILKALQVCDEKVFGSHEKYRYKVTGEKIAEKEHEVTVRDLDFNYHVNNLSYIGLAVETVNPEILGKYSVDNYRVKFLKEAYLGDILCCEIYNSENNIIARIFNKTDNSDVCFIVAKYSSKKDFVKNPREVGIIIN